MGSVTHRSTKTHKSVKSSVAKFLGFFICNPKRESRELKASNGDIVFNDSSGNAAWNVVDWPGYTFVDERRARARSEENMVTLELC